MRKDRKKIQKIIKKAIKEYKEVIIQAYQFAVSGQDVFIGCDLQKGQLFLDYSNDQEQFYQTHNQKKIIILAQIG